MLRTLYPDFNDLVALKGLEKGLIHPANRSVKSIAPGDHHSPFRGQGLEFDSVREYVPGDDIRNIDWRVTARTGAPHLKLFKEDRERQIVICVDMNAAMRFGTRNTFKSVQAARIAALLGWRAIANHDRVSACLFGDVPGGIHFFSPQRTRKSLTGMLKMLSEPPTKEHSIALEDAIQQVSRSARSGALVYIISDFMESYAETGIRRLSQNCDVVFIAVNDPADKSICAIGTIGFCASGKQKIHVNTDSSAGREAYAAQWDENRRQLHELTSRCKVQMIELSTESNVPRELIVGLKNIAKRKRR